MFDIKHQKNNAKNRYIYKYEIWFLIVFRVEVWNKKTKQTKRTITVPPLANGIMKLSVNIEIEQPIVLYLSILAD